ncbi:MAG: ABA4-like family protein [Bacteroidota bacterium]
MEDTIFLIANAFVLIGWVLLIFLPDADFLSNVIHYGVVLLLAITYTVVIPMGFSEAPDGGFGSIEEVRALFASDWGLLAGWIHYLAFDLFVGHWVNGQARQIKLHVILRILCLLATFMAGPFGLLLFFIFKAIRVRTSS